jgi:hypothetical protein
MVDDSCTIDWLADVRARLARLEPRTFGPGDAASMTDALAATEKACAAARASMAARGAATAAHRALGFATALDWIATTTGSTIPEARRELAGVAAVEHLADTRAALRSGEISLAQAGEIARTADEVDGSECEMLELARTSSLGVVRNRGRKLRVAVIDPDELYEKQRAARSVTMWRDEIGMVCGSFALTPEVGIRLCNLVERETDPLRREARASGHPLEARVAYAADALAAVLAGVGAAGAGTVVLNIVIDWPALVRGHCHPGERSHLVDGGPIPPGLVRQLCRNAFVKAVLTNGTKVQRVEHFGRHLPEEVRTALELGPPSDFEGVTCADLGCERRYGLQWDHVVPYAGGGPTSMWNLLPRCEPHHIEKTKRDRAKGWRGT